MTSPAVSVALNLRRSYHRGMSPEALADATCGEWAMSEDAASRITTVIGVVGSMQVIEAEVIGWAPSADDRVRFEFAHVDVTERPAPEWARWRRGQANPVRFAPSAPRRSSTNFDQIAELRQQVADLTARVALLENGATASGKA